MAPKNMLRDSPQAPPRDTSASSKGCGSPRIGIGTYLGEPDERTDQAYADAVVAAVESGANVIDSAINYRFQRSERSVGAALEELATARLRAGRIIDLHQGRIPDARRRNARRCQ
jgi:diketogulonate reductase-like aldo/keto reductase